MCDVFIEQQHEEEFLILLNKFCHTQGSAKKQATYYRLASAAKYLDITSICFVQQNGVASEMHKKRTFLYWAKVKRSSKQIKQDQPGRLLTERSLYTVSNTIPDITLYDALQWTASWRQKIPVSWGETLNIGCGISGVTLQNPLIPDIVMKPSMHLGISGVAAEPSSRFRTIQCNPAYRKTEDKARRRIVLDSLGVMLCAALKNVI